MKTRAELHVDGVDLENDATLETIGAYFSKYGWDEYAGAVTVTVHAEPTSAVEEILEVARAIMVRLPGARVVRVDDQLVGATEIATRIGLTREAVRLWSAGKRGAAKTPFPRARGHLRQSGNTAGSAAVWSWPDIVEWLRAERNLDPEPGIGYLTSRQIGSINARLASAPIETAADQNVGLMFVVPVLEARIEQGAWSRCPSGPTLRAPVRQGYTAVFRTVTTLLDEHDSDLDRSAETRRPKHLVRS